MAKTPPPFLRVEIKDGADKLVLTRERADSTQVRIETTSRVIYCPVSDVHAALDAIIGPEANQLRNS